MESVAIWLILIDGLNKGKVALQKRTEKDGDKLQSFPYILQPTWNGKLEQGENIQEAIKREAKEELGVNFKVPEGIRLFYTSEYEFKGALSKSYNFSSPVLEQEINVIKLHSGAESKFIFVSKDDLSKIKICGEHGVDARKDWVLFKDQYEALKKLFEIY